jgi:glucosamine-6-phosphate deaminase
MVYPPEKPKGDTMMGASMDMRDLYRWCAVPAESLVGHPDLKVPFRLVKDSTELGELMARELAAEIALANRAGRPYRAIIPCGPRCWYEPFARIVNEQRISLARLTVFHMDECLDWEGRLLPKQHPYNFRTFMDRYFYAPIRPELSVPVEHRVYPEVARIAEIERRIDEAPIDITLGGWGQDGHVAYNQARRNAYSTLSIEQLRQSRIRVQENNTDTIIALGARTFGAAWQFVPPMSITLGLKECLSAAKVRLHSDTGSWKQTALRVALFSPETVEYPMTLLQRHPDAIITATMETAAHPISLNPDWELF